MARTGGRECACPRAVEDVCDTLALLVPKAPLEPDPDFWVPKKRVGIPSECLSLQGWEVFLTFFLSYKIFS